MRVIIGHPDGREFSVTVADHKRLYEADGFSILRNEDGTDYAGTAGKSDEAKKARANALARDRRAAKKAAATATPAEEPEA